MLRSSLRRRLTAESIGTAMLLATVVGSGIMVDQLAGGNAALAREGRGGGCRALYHRRLLAYRVHRLCQSGRHFGTDVYRHFLRYPIRRHAGICPGATPRCGHRYLAGRVVDRKPGPLAAARQLVHGSRVKTFGSAVSRSASSAMPFVSKSHCNGPARTVLSPLGVIRIS